MDDKRTVAVPPAAPCPALRDFGGETAAVERGGGTALHHQGRRAFQHDPCAMGMHDLHEPAIEVDLCSFWQKLRDLPHLAIRGPGDVMQAGDPSCRIAERGRVERRGRLRSTAPLADDDRHDRREDHERLDGDGNRYRAAERCERLAQPSRQPRQPRRAGDGRDRLGAAFRRGNGRCPAR